MSAANDPASGDHHVTHGSAARPEYRRVVYLLRDGRDAQVIGEPRVTGGTGEIKSVKAGPGKRLLTIEYQPAGGSSAFDPNGSLTVAWTVRGKESDMVVVARTFVHVNDDGTYSLGYVTPRPTIAEMAAPPIRSGPTPPQGAAGSDKG